MADDKKKILIDVLVQASDSIKKIADLRKNVADLREQQKELDLTTQEGREAYEAYAAEIRATNAEIRKRNKEIDNSVKQAMSEKTSLDALSASMANMKARYRAMSDEQRNAADGVALQQAILATNDALRLTEEGYGQYARNAANYRKANQKMTEELKALEDDLLAVSKQFLALSEAEREGEIGQQLITRMNELRTQIDNTGTSLDDLVVSQQQYSQSIISLISNNNTLTGSLMNMATSSDGASGMFSQLGVQGKALGKTLLTLAMNPVVLTIAAIVAVCALLAKAFQRNEENGDKLNVVMAKVGGIFQWLLKVLEPVATFLVDNLIIAFEKLSEAVEWTLNKIASVMEYLGLESAAKWVRETTEDVKKMTEASAKLAKAEAELRKEQRESEKIQKDYQKRAEKLRQLRDDDTKSIAERIKANEELGAVLQEQLQKELAIAQKALEVANLRVEVEGRTTENLDAQSAALTKIADIQERITGQESEQIKNATSLKKEASDKAIELFNKTLDAKLALDESLLRAESDYQSEDFAKRQEYERKLFKLTNDTEREKLAVLRKHGKITQKEYDTQLAVLEAKQQEFNNSQVKGLNDYFRDQLAEISSMVEQDVDAQIKDTQEKFAKAREELQNIQEPVKLVGQSEEDFEKEYGKYKALMLEKALLEKQLEEQQAKEIEAIHEASLQKRISDIEKYVDKQYQDDFDKFLDNEREKNRVEIEALNEIIRKKKEAGISVAADEAALRSLTSQANQIELNTELIQANENAKAKYEARKAYLEKEKELYKDNADKQIELNAQLAENDREYMQSRIENFAEYRDATLQMMSGLNDFLTAISDAEIQKYEEQNDEKKAMLQERLDQGLISQEEYDAQVEQADAELEKKKKDAERKQAIREKMMKVFQITTDTAMGIAKAVALSPLTFGMPFSAFMGATGALQLATVLATPLPKAARGGLIGGKPHSQGGTIIEAERGESIMTRRTTEMFGPLLSMLNELGGGVPFAKPMSDGGFSIRTNQQNTITPKDLEEAMSTAVEKMKVVTYVEDYEKVSTEYNEVVNNPSNDRN